MYIVLEIQVERDGTTRVLEPAFYEDKGRALQKYYTILSYAVVSELAKHSAMIVTDDAMVMKSECYIREEEEEEENED